MMKTISYIGYRITERCNKHCPFCFSREKELVKDQSLSEIEKFLQNIVRAKIPTIGIMGGEPMLRKDIIDILKITKNYKFEVILSTNATLIKQKQLDELNGLIDYLSISLDNYDEFQNDKFRGFDQYKSATRIINIYEDYRYNFRLKVNTVVHKLNINNGIDEIPELFNNKNIIWKLLQFTPRLKGKEVEKKFAISKKEFINKAMSLKQKFPKIKIAYRTYTFDEKYDLLIIRPNGDLEINYGDSYKLVGNAYKDEIRDVIQKVWNKEQTYYNENWDEFRLSYR